MSDLNDILEHARAQLLSCKDAAVSTQVLAWIFGVRPGDGRLTDSSASHLSGLSAFTLRNWRLKAAKMMESASDQRQADAFSAVLRRVILAVLVSGGRVTPQDVVSAISDVIAFPPAVLLRLVTPKSCGGADLPRIVGETLDRCHADGLACVDAGFWMPTQDGEAAVADMFPERKVGVK